MTNNNFDFNNQNSSNDPFLNEDYMSNKQEDNYNKNISTNYEYVEDKSVSEINVNNNLMPDFSLPTNFEDYLVFSRNFYAGFWLRYVAFVIDVVAIMAIVGLVNTLTFNLLNVRFNFLLIGEAALSYVLVMFCYYILMTYYFSQTLGKMIMKIKVETNKGEKLTFSTVVYREVVGRLLTIGLMYIPYIAIPFMPKKKGLHDYIADTVVVKEDFSSFRKKMNEKLDNMR